MFRSTGLTPAGSPTEKKTRPARWALALFMALAALLFAPLQARAGGVTFTAAAGSYYDGYGLGSDGNIYAWGWNSSGQLGNGLTASSPAPVPVDASALPAGALPFKAVAAGFYSGYGLGSDDNIYAWGQNNYGQLGNNSTDNSLVPVQVIRPAGVTFTAVASGPNSFSGYGLGLDGNIYAWGEGDSGQLGNGLTNNSLTPVQVSMPAGAPAGFMFTAVAAGRMSAYALGSDDNIYAWGSNIYGALGNNSPFDSSVPVQVSMPAGVPAGFKFTAVAAAGYSGYGLGSDGNIYAWGSNNAGQLGHGNTTDSLVPVPVNTSNLPTGVTFTAVTAGYGLGSDGNLYAWGYNGSGQLGNDSTTQSLVPVQVNMPAGVPDGFTFTAASAGNASGYGLGSDGNLYAWGSNGNGQLGYNTSIPQSLVPVRVYMANWGILLTVPGIVSETYTFGAETYGYATPPSETVTVTNAGNQDTGPLALALSGADADKFQLSASPVSLANLAPTVGNSMVFTVSPISGLDAGTYTATVTVNAAAGNTNPIEPQTFDVSFTVNPATPAPADFSFTPASATYDGGAHPVTVSPLASVTGMGAITAVYYNGSTAEPTAAGIYEITIDVDAGANYAAATGLSLGNFAIDAADQTITFGATSPVVVAGTATVTASTTAMPAASYPITFSTTSTACTVTSAGVITGVHAGTNNCVIAASQAGDANYSPATTMLLLSIGKGSQTITFGTAPTTVVVAATSTGTVTASSSLGAGYSVTFSTTDANCSVTSAGAVTGLHAGNCTITATQAGSADYNGATNTQTLTVGKGSQTITFGPAPTTVIVATTSTGAVTASSSLGAGYPVTFSATDANCTVTSAGAVTGLHAGSCTITATQAGDADYNGATNTQTLTVGKGAQTITFGAAPTTVIVAGTSTGTVTATTTATPAASYSITFSTADPNCTVTSAGAVTGVHAGSCLITATQAGGADYNSATATQTLNIGKGSQTITFGAAPTTVIVAGTSTGTVTASSSLGAGYSVTFSTTDANCSVTSAGAVTGLHAGSCTITATQAGDADYNGATNTQTLNVGKGSQTLTFGPAPTTVIVAPTSTGAVTASSSLGAGYPVTFSTTDANCTVTSAGAVTGLHAGSCTITATQAGDADYNGATNTQTLTIGKGSQTITFGPAPSVAVAGTGTVTASTTATPAVSYPITFSTTSANCTVTSAGLVTGVGAGSCLITATQLGGADYNAATNTQTLTIGITSQTITFGAAPTVVVAGTGTVTASTTAMPAASYPITFSSTSAGCTVTSAGAVTGVHAGTNNCVIAAAQAGDASYSPATATQTLSIGKASQTITFGAAPTVHVTGTGTVSASTTATPAASHAITYSTTSTDCTVNASTGVVTGVHAGANNCVITATQAGDANYNSASTTQTLSIAQDPTPAVTLSATPNPATVGASVTITATVAGDPPTGNVTFCDGATTTDATCTGGTVLCSAVPLVPATVNSTASCAHTFSSAGAQTITALYSGDADFAQAETALALSLNVVALSSGGDAVAIPTLSQWALALLALLLAGGAVVHSRRARRGS